MNPFILIKKITLQSADMEWHLLNEILIQHKRTHYTYIYINI